MTQQPDIEQMPEDVAAFCADADAHIRDGKPDDAQRCLNFALDALRTVNRPRAQARVLETLARLQRSTGHMSQAEGSLRAALACYLRLGDRAEEARLLGDLASMRINQGDFADGGFWLMSSLEVMRALNNRPGLAEIHRNLASLHFRTGDMPKAEEDSVLAIELYLSLGNTIGEARAQCMFAQILLRRSAFAAAHAAAERGLELFTREAHKPGASSARMIIAAILRHEGRLSEAEALLTEVLSEKRAMKDRAGEAGVLNTLGLVIVDMDKTRLRDAERHLLRSIELFREVNDPQNAAMTQVNLGDLYNHLGRHDDAENVIRAALKQFRKSGALESEKRVMRELGLTLILQGRIADADEAFRDALEFARSYGNGSMAADILPNWAELKILRGHSDEVREVAAAIEEQTAPTRAFQIRYLLPTHARIALAAQDIDAARALAAKAEQALTEEAEEARPGLRKPLDQILEAIKLTESEPEWPLFRGFRPNELAPALRKALIADLPPEEQAKLPLSMKA